MDADGVNPRYLPHQSAETQHPPQSVASQGSWHMHTERTRPVTDTGELRHCASCLCSHWHPIRFVGSLLLHKVEAADGDVTTFFTEGPANLQCTLPGLHADANLHVVF